MTDETNEEVKATLDPISAIDRSKEIKVAAVEIQNAGIFHITYFLLVVQP